MSQAAVNIALMHDPVMRTFVAFAACCKTAESVMPVLPPGAFPRYARKVEFCALPLPGLIEVIPVRHGDARGHVMETFRADRFAEAAGPWSFVQDNQAFSARAGTIRGLHFQTSPMAQGKLVRCVAGAICDVAVDLRHDSPTFGHWLARELSADNGRQLWLPPGFAHGFCTLLPDSVVCYKCTASYSPAHERGVRWDDAAIGVVWPALADPDTLSPRDRALPLLADVPPLFARGDGV